eukprot:gene12632-6536_t
MLVDNEENLVKCTSAVNQKEIVYFDTEGYHPIYTKKVAIIQFGIVTENSKEDTEIFLIDCLQLDSELIKKYIKPILESKKIKKIIHDVKRDSEILFNQFGITCNGIFDTQIAYNEYLKKEKKDSIQLCSFVNVLKECCSVDYSEKNSLPHYEIIDAAKLFFDRPFDQQLLDCAFYDVKYLHELYLFFVKNLTKEEFFFIEKLSDLWSKSYIFYEKIEKKNDSITYFDFTFFDFLDLSNESFEEEKNEKMKNYLLRLFRVPDLKIMKRIIGKEGKNIIELKKKFKNSYIYTAGRTDPPIDSLFFLGTFNEAEEFTKMLPNKIIEKIVCGDILKTPLLKRIQMDTKTTIMLMTNEMIGYNYFKTIIIGKEDDIKEAIEKMKQFIKE